MMHKLKKAATASKGQENAEFGDYKNRLDNLCTYLKESSGMLKQSEAAWREVCNQQKAFSDKFATKYPDKDKVRAFAKQSATASQGLVKEFVLKTDGSSASHWVVDAVVQDYIGEIEDIASEYKPVQEAMKEVAMYTKKVDDLQSGKKQDEIKIARNMEKLEEAKKQYDDILDRVVDKMKAVYNKRQVALKATYIAYWSSQLRAGDLLDGSLDAVREFVEWSTENLTKVKIRSMTEEMLEEFLERNSAVPETGSSRSSPAGSAGRRWSPATSPSKTAENAAEAAGGGEDGVVAQKVAQMSPVEGEAETPAEPPAAEI